VPAEPTLLSLVADYATAHAVDMHWPADRLANETDPMAVLAAAAEALGKGIGVTRAFYAEIDYDLGETRIALDWTNGVASQVGTHPFKSKSMAVQRMLRDGVTIVEDVDSLDVDAEVRAFHKTVDNFAWVAMPLMEGDRPIALVGVTNATPRTFSAADVRFVREVGNRTWHALIHVRALARLRESQAAIEARAQHETFFRTVAEDIAADRSDATILFKIVAMVSRYLRVGDATIIEPIDVDATRVRMYRAAPDPTQDRLVKPIPMPPHKLAWFAALRGGTDIAHAVEACGPRTLWGGVSAVTAPVMESGRVVLALSVETQMRRCWSDADVRLIEDLVNLAWTTIRRVRADAAIAERDRGQTLLLEWNDAVRDAAGVERVVETTLGLLAREFVDVTPVYAECDANGRATAVWTMINGRVRRIRGSDADARRWASDAQTVAQADPDWEGDIAHTLVAPSHDQGRMVARLVLEVDQPRGWTLVEHRTLRDIADRLWSRLARLRTEEALAQREADLAFLIGWSDAVRDAEDADAIIAHTLAHLAQRFDGAVPCLDELGEDGARIERTWCRIDGALHTERSDRPLTELGASVVDALRRGRGIAIADANRTPLPKPYAARGPGAVLATPIVSGGRLMAVLTIHVRTARSWSVSDRHLVGALAERVWSSVARVRDRADLVRSRTALSQAERMAALGAVLGGISHELNNPLAVVTAQAQLIAMLAQGTDLAERAHKVHEAGDRCARIIRNFAAIARQTPPDRQRVEIDDVLVRAIRQVSAIDGCDIHSVVARPLPSVLADPDQIYQILINLLVNARQAIARSDGGDMTIRVRTWADAASVHVEVADAGSGVPADLHARIFEPFFTTKPVGEGTGMGLSLAQGMAELHGGTLVLMPSAAGAVFRLTLPIDRG